MQYTNPLVLQCLLQLTSFSHECGTLLQYHAVCNITSQLLAKNGGEGGGRRDGLPLIIIIEGTYQKVYSLYRNSESPMKSRIHSCGYNAYSWRIHAISQYRAAISKVFIMANGLDLILLVSFGNIKDKFGPEISGFLAIFECTKAE